MKYRQTVIWFDYLFAEKSIYFSEKSKYIEIWPISNQLEIIFIEIKISIGVFI
jgi:uncharacterized membrane protein YfbV (UPF0208 family)